MTNPNDPAFPKLPLNQGDQGISYPGLTKREYFAGLAMQGCAIWDALMHKNDVVHAGKVRDVAMGAVALADALIAELNKRNDPD